ncbi:phosphatidylserine decarboxylase family protein [Nonlabens ulvanivorans]|uniref:Phosphatidylserine decarboxylase n=2 Tax=Nonlabens ulvanivorans TaxID=906888 RepID=A0A084JYZ6_NONUL|nr:phosphatidylserine decarboxylase family protein [Nonlabens ulvanivorans]KEZ94180.1 phosphatidylserine decarboxylase [Nonlabens ulvanivorans]PRX13170.1 phosphatidylserine decarboxylase [Nonlabens ulvanivorans]
MFHKEGTISILIGIAVAGMLTAIATQIDMPNWLSYTLIALGLVFLIIILQFFRNPKRATILDDKTIVSPVDGKVVVIEKVQENEYFKGERLMISVFMSPINVHVTRYPIGGKVSYSKYHPGKYLVAWHPKASEENERTTVVVNHKNGKQVMHRQIAGALAKRIVNYAVENNEVAQGSESGFIKFGSRVDVYLPIDTPVNVELNQKVKGGITVLAQF